MNIEIITAKLQLEVFGFGSVAVNKDYTGTAFKLSGSMWELVKSNNIKNKGKNIWIYDSADKVFAGVELENNTDGISSGLEHKILEIEKYAHYRHIGPYHLIKRSGQMMTEQLSNMGFEITTPYVEIYGHWVKDETKLETELIMSLK